MKPMNLKFTFVITAFLAVIALTSTKLLPSSCAELLVDGYTSSGVYTIHPRPRVGTCPFKVYCDMETDGGGWTLFQKRDDYEIQENFFRNWTDYKDGFGSLERDFWLGNEYLHILTAQDRVSLRVDLEDFEGEEEVAEYKYFYINNEKNSYNLTVSGYHGNAYDGFTSHSGSIFVTIDKKDVNSCASKYSAGWWFSNCPNPNGLYKRGNYSSPITDGVFWPWKKQMYSLKKTEMKIRPFNFSPHWSYKQEQ